METRRLGATDLEASVLGLGCNNFGMKIGLEESRVESADELAEPVGAVVDTIDRG